MASPYVKTVESLICNCWPSWKRFDRSVKELEGSHRLSHEYSELFRPFEGYFRKYIRNKKKYSYLLTSNIYGFRLDESRIIIEGFRGKEKFIRPGPYLRELVEAFQKEKRSKVMVIGLLFSVIGIISSTLSIVFWPLESFLLAFNIFDPSILSLLYFN